MLRVRLGRLRPLGLQRRIMLYVSAGLLVFSAIYAVVALQAVQQASELVFGQRLLTASTVSSAMDDSVAHLQDELRDASDAVASAVATNDLVRVQISLHALANHLNRSYELTEPCRISLTDTNGNLLWVEPAATAPANGNLAELVYWRETAQSQEPVITNGTAADGSGRATIVLTMPIRNGAQPVGFLIAELDRTNIGTWLETSLGVPMPDRMAQSIQILDDGGQLIASRAAEDPRDIAQHFQLVAPAWRAGQAGTFIHTRMIGGEDRSHVIAFAPLTQVHWGVVIEQPEDEALSVPRNLQVRFMIFGLFALLGGLALAWFTTRAVVWPVNALIGASREIAHGDLERPLDISGADEVGALARSFDEMRMHLKGSREEIAQWNRELEARVDRRTRELSAALTREEQRTRELTALVESSHALTSTLELDTLFDILMQATRSVLPSAEGIALLLHEPENQALRVASSVGLDACESRQLRWGVDDAISSKAFTSQAPVLLQTAVEVKAAQAHLPAENRAHFQQAVGNRAVQSALGVPLSAKGAPLGALMLYNFSREGAFAESEIPVLQALADQAATAIENARLYQEASEVGALRELNRVKSEFVARASHELRTPLAGIKRLAEILARDDLKIDAPTQREFLLEINHSSDRLARIVEELLTLARIEAGRLETRREPVEVEEIIAHVVTQFRKQFPERAIDIDVPRELPPVSADAERLGDVLTNLLSNALKYSGPKQPVVVRAERQNGQIHIAVRDQGIGIPADAQPRIFERFYRVDNALTRRVGGAGLGLYICKSYVEAMGGSMRFQSELGRGSTFEFNLPLDGGL